MKLVDIPSQNYNRKTLRHDGMLSLYKNDKPKMQYGGWKIGTKDGSVNISKYPTICIQGRGVSYLQLELYKWSTTVKCLSKI
jgi:hypothetical protein